MFQSEMQRAAVCEHLCQTARLRDRMWTLDPPGPTQAAIQVVRGKAPLSHGEKLMVLAAWDIWNGTGKCRVGELVDVLDGTNLATLGDCLKAIANGPRAVTRWLGEGDTESCGRPTGAV